LQTLLYGFGGLDITNAGLSQLKGIKLPNTWKSLTLKGIGPNKQSIIIKN
jgi:protein-glucosylgalactosylhydroxylysine glucosidase